jgi:hypothetical protein
MTSGPRHPPPTASAPAGIDRSLRSLRRLARGSLAVRGVSLVLVALAGLGLFSLGVDRYFRLSVTSRGIALAIYAGLWGWIAWRYLIHPLVVRLPGNLLADLLERRFPQLQDRLRSAVDFLRDPALFAPGAPEGGEDLAHLMKRAVTAQAAEQLERVAGERLVDRPRVLRPLAAGVLALGLFAAVGALSGSTFQLWLRRQVLLADVEYPYRTRLEVEGFRGRERGVWRGDPLTLRVRAEGEMPKRVSIEIDYQSDSARYAMAREGREAATFIHEHPAISEPFRFVVDGGDFRSRPHRVRVLERPAVESLTVTVTPPAYTGQRPKKFAGDVGEVPIPTGSTVRLDGRANKALLRAWLETEESEETPGEEEPPEPPENLAPSARRQLELEVARGAGGDGRSFSGAYKPRAGGLVTVRLRDEESSRLLEDDTPHDVPLRFSIHLVPDRHPTVQLKVDGLGPLITGAARMPLVVTASDDYRVEKIGLRWSLEAAEGPGETREAPLPALEQPGHGVKASQVWEVSDTRVQPEKRLSVQVGATDNDGLAGAKTGYSPPLSFLVVTVERLGEEFLRREEEQRRALERILESEKKVKDTVYGLFESWQKEGGLPEPVVEQMLALERTERQHGRQLLVIAGAVRQILAEMQNNRVGEAKDLERLVKLIIEPLEELGRDILPDVSARLGRIRGAETRARIDEEQGLIEVLEKKVEMLENVLLNMVKLEGFTEIVKNLRAIIKVQDEATRATLEAYRKERDTLFEPETGGGDGEE